VRKREKKEASLASHLQLQQLKWTYCTAAAAAEASAAGEHSIQSIHPSIHPLGVEGEGAKDRSSLLNEAILAAK